MDVQRLLHCVSNDFMRKSQRNYSHCEEQPALFFREAILLSNHIRFDIFNGRAKIASLCKQ